MNRSLGAKLIVAYTGLCILAVISLSLYVDNRLKDLLLERLRADVRTQAGLVSEAVASPLSRGERDDVTGFLRRADDHSDARILVVGKDIPIVATSSKEGPAPSWAEAVALPRIKDALDGHPSDEMTAPPHGDELLAVSRPITRNGKIVGAVRVSYQLSDVEGNFRRVQFAIGAGALVTALASTVLGILFARRIIGPLLELSHAAHALKDGDLSRRVTPRSSDEVGDLVRSFNAMADRLREYDLARREFASDVSHELWSLASAMQAAAEALERGARRDPSLTERLVAGLVQHTRRLGRLANDLKEQARLDGGRMSVELEGLDLAELARNCADEFAAEAERLGIRLIVEAPEPLLTRGDPDRLAQALGNLVENALKYSPRGTAITVRARRAEQGFALDVLDEGMGIPAEKLPRVFERYYRVEGRASGGPGGMGLGLNIVAGIARAHGGRVEAQPRPSGGTMFTIYLPAPATQPLSVTGREPTGLVAPRRGPAGVVPALPRPRKSAVRSSRVSPTSTAD